MHDASVCLKHIDLLDGTNGGHTDFLESRLKLLVIIVALLVGDLVLSTDGSFSSNSDDLGDLGGGCVGGHDGITLQRLFGQSEKEKEKRKIKKKNRKTLTGGVCFAFLEKKIQRKKFLLFLAEEMMTETEITIGASCRADQGVKHQREKRKERISPQDGVDDLRVEDHHQHQHMEHYEEG